MRQASFEEEAGAKTETPIVAGSARDAGALTVELVIKNKGIVTCERLHCSLFSFMVNYGPGGRCRAGDHITLLCSEALLGDWL